MREDVWQKTYGESYRDTDRRTDCVEKRPRTLDIDKDRVSSEKDNCNCDVSDEFRKEKPTEDKRDDRKEVRENVGTRSNF